MNSDQNLLSARQAATYLGVTHQRLYQLAEAGRFGRQLGTTWIFTQQELDGYKQERMHRPKGGRPKGSTRTRRAADPMKS